jgi:hypothetical protein
VLYRYFFFLCDVPPPPSILYKTFDIKLYSREKMVITYADNICGCYNTHIYTVSARLLLSQNKHIKYDLFHVSLKYLDHRKYYTLYFSCLNVYIFLNCYFFFSAFNFHYYSLLIFFGPFSVLLGLFFWSNILNYIISFYCVFFYNDIFTGENTLIVTVLLVE